MWKQRIVTQSPFTFSGLPYPEKKDFGEGEQEDFPKKRIQEAL